MIGFELAAWVEPRIDEGDWVGLKGLWIIFTMENFHRVWKCVKDRVKFIFWLDG